MVFVFINGTREDFCFDYINNGVIYACFHLNLYRIEFKLKLKFVVPSTVLDSFRKF